MKCKPRDWGYRDQIVDAILAQYPNLKDEDREKLEKYRSGEGTVLSFSPPPLVQSEEKL